MKQALLRSFLVLSLSVLAAGCPKQVGQPHAIGTGPATVASGSVVMLDASQSTDPSGRELYTTWSFVSIPAGSAAVLKDPASLKPSFVADLPGDYVARLVVSNGVLTSAPALVTVTASQCGVNVPVTGALASAPASPGVGTVVTLTAPAAADADNASECGLSQALGYRWWIATQPPGSTATLNNPAALNPSFVADQAGQYTVRLVITDSTGRASPQAEVAVTAGTCGSNPPVVAAITPSWSLLAQPGVGTPIQLTATVTDADVDACGLTRTLTYLWSIRSAPQGSAAVLTNPAAVNPSFTPDVAGSYQVRLVVTDSLGRSSAPLDKSIPVAGVGCGLNPPVATISTAVTVPPQAGAGPFAPGVGSTVQLTAAVADLDDPSTVPANSTKCTLQETFIYSWSLRALPAGSRATLNGTSSADPSFIPDAVGTYVVGAVVTDHAGLQAIVDTPVVVRCGSSVPSIVAMGATTTSPLVKQMVTLSATLADADVACGPLATPAISTSLSYAWSVLSAPAGSAVTTASLSLATASAPSFKPDVVGHYQVGLVAISAKTTSPATTLRSALRTLELTAASCGFNAPTVAPGATVGGTAAPDVTNIAVKPGAAVALTANAADADNAAGCSAGQTVTTAWSVVSRPAASSAVLSSLTAPDPSFTPDVPGAYQLSVTATDSSGLTSAAAFVGLRASTCGFNAPTVAPSATVGATAAADVTNIAANPGNVVSLLANAADIDNGTDCGAGQTLTTAWTVVSRPAASSAVLSSLTAPDPTFTPDVPGVYRLSLTASDSTGLTSLAATLGLRASTCGFVPPGVSASAAPAATTLGNAFTLTAVAADNNGAGCAASTPFTYRWTTSARPAGSLAQLSALSGASPTFTPDVVGVYGFVVTTTDANGQTSAPASVNVSVGPCATAAPGVTFSPALTGTTQGVIALNNAHVSGQNCMAKAGVYTYAWSFLAKPAGSSQAFFDNPAAAVPSFTPDVVGSYSVQLVATDSLGNPGSAVQTIVVSSCGTASPTLDAITFSAVAPDGTTSSATANVNDRVSFSTVVHDPNGSCGTTVQPFSYSWSLLSRPAASQAALGAGTAASPSFFIDAVGTYQLRVVVTDAVGNVSAPATFSLSTTACGSEKPTVVVGYTALQSGASSALPYTGSAGTWTATATDTVTGSCPARFKATSFSYSWQLVAQPAGSVAKLSATSAAGVLVGTPSTVGFVPDQSGGPYTVEVIATTNLGLASAPTPKSFTADACGANPPSVGSLAVSQPYAPALVNTTPAALYADYPVTLSTPISDPDNTLASCNPVVSPPQQLTVQWSFTSLPAGSKATLLNANTQNPSFTPDLMSSATPWRLQVVATDSTGRSTTGSYSVSTNGCGGNAPVPWVGLLAPATVASVPTSAAAAVITNTPVQVEGSKSTDADNQGTCTLGQTLSYLWSFTAVPAGSQARLNNAALADPSFTPDVDGVYVLSLLVSDNVGLVSAPGTMTVTATSQGNLAAAGVGPYSVVATDAAGIPSILVYDNVGGTLSLIRCTANCTTALPTWSTPVQIDTNLGTLTNQGGGTDARPIDLKISGAHVYAAYHFLTGGNSCGVKVAASADGVTWAKTTIESTTNCTANGTGTNEWGRWLSLALGPDTGNVQASVPAVAYYKQTGTASVVRYALCNGTMANCLTTTNAGSYNKQDVQNATLAGNSTQGLWPSLRFTSTGSPRVAYYVSTTAFNTTSLAYAEGAGNGIGSAWVASTTSNPLVDTGSAGGNDVGRYASLDLVAVAGGTLDQPRIAYRDENNTQLKYAICASSCTGGTGSWTRRVIDGNGDVGRFSSLALSPSTGNARIAYYDVNNRELRYASQSGLSSFKLSVLDNSSGDVGQQASLAVSPQGNPRVSYWDAAFGNIKYLGFGP